MTSNSLNPNCSSFVGEQDDELLNIAPTEYKIIDMFYNSSKNQVYIQGSDSFGIVSSSETSYEWKVTTGVFLPKNLFEPISNSNPLVVYFVPGCNAHIIAKNIALLTIMGMTTDDIKEFSDSNSNVTARELDTNWGDFFIEFASQRLDMSYQEISKYVDLLDGNEQMFPFESGDMRFAGFTTIQEEIDSQNNLIAMPIVDMYLKGVTFRRFD